MYLQNRRPIDKGVEVLLFESKSFENFRKGWDCKRSKRQGDNSVRRLSSPIVVTEERTS